MAYQLGTALHVDDLLGKLSIFAVADGWTENKIVAGSGDGHSSELYLQKGSEAIISFAANFSNASVARLGITAFIDHPYLRMYGATGYDTNDTVGGQPGTSSYSQVNWVLPGMNYWFFSDGGVKPYIHVVLEITSGEFRHFGFGVMDKAGAWTGGFYMWGLNCVQSAGSINNPAANHAYPFHRQQHATSSNKFRVDVDGSQWKTMGKTQLAPTRAVGLYGGDSSINVGIYDGFLEQLGITQTRPSTPNTFNGVSPLFPMLCIIGRSALNSLCGCIVDMKLVNIKHYAPASSFVLGSDTWHVFPVVTKQAVKPGNTENNTYFIGYAYREVT